MGTRHLTVGEMIAEMRGIDGRTQKQMASAVGLSPQYWNDIESGRRIPPPETIMRISTVLEVDAHIMMWLWVRQHVGDEITDRMMAGSDDDGTAEGYAYGLDSPADHPYVRRGSWSHDEWCAVDGCTSMPSAHPEMRRTE